MKSWITYLTSLFLALATALLLGDTTWILPLLYGLSDVAVNVGSLMALVMVALSTSSAVASLRKDRMGGQVVSSSILWALFTAILLPLFAALVAAAFPVAFPVSTTAGTGSVSDTYLQSVFSGSWSLVASGNLAYYLTAAGDSLLPVIILALVLGVALKPSSDIIKPAYITINSLSEVCYRIARGLSNFGYILVYFTSALFFTYIYQEKTFFVDAAFSTMLVVTPIILSFVLLPVIFEAFTRGKKNPYKILYRNTASQLTALTSGSYIASMPYIMAGERINDGVQKRIASTTSPLYYIIGHGGSAAVATFSLIAVIANVTGAPVQLSVCVAIALAATVCSFASSLSNGFEVMFITIAILRLLNIELYSAEVTMLGILPLLSGLGAIMDSQIAILGANMTASKAGVDITPSYKDIL